MSVIVVSEHVSGYFDADLDTGLLMLLAGVGASGPAGTSLPTNNRGSWSPTKTYIQNDSVVYQTGTKWDVWVAATPISSGSGNAPGVIAA